MAIGHMPDKLLDVHAAVPERAALLVWFGDLRLERDNPFKARREVGHLALLLVSADHAEGRPAGPNALSLRPSSLTSHMTACPVPPQFAARGSLPMGIATDAADWPTKGLDEGMLAADPHDQFDRWMADVIEAGLPEPTALVLATVSAAGQPRARMVLLKGHDKN